MTNVRQACHVYKVFQQPVTVLPGVGPALGKRLAARDVRCLGDLLLHLPKRYIDDRKSIPIRELQAGVEARTQGLIAQVGSRGHPNKKQVVITLEDDSGASLNLCFFRSPFLLRDARLVPGRMLSVRGVPEWWRGVCQMLHPVWQPLEAHRGGWQPVYTALAGLPSRRVAGFIQRAIAILPAAGRSPVDELLSGCPSFSKALHLVHQPRDRGPDTAEAQGALERLRLEELLTYLHLMKEKRRQAQVEAPPLSGAGLADQMCSAFPYPLTKAQEKVWQEIRRDLISGQRMHRLLHGDVGAGKTWVAALALLTAVDSGYQAALMAPTEVLANQHARTLNELFQPLGIKTALLSGGLRAVQRREILAGLAGGDIPIVVGTHALISEDVRYARLGLAVVDEQHRFGVRQRWQLAERGEAVHLLVMTATPIPRSLALALYGDMDLSLMRGMPPGRKPVTTTVVAQHRRSQLADGIHRILQEGGRVYWIVPRIDEEEDGVSVSQREEALKGRFPDAGVMGLHGRMKAKEKQSVLDAFSDGSCRILVSTTVVEVGVNVPEARLIVVEHAERYGLAQLHQLRGRVGRSSEQGYCVLLPGQDASEASLARLRHMARLHDGLELAELDLKLRGAGDALGARQSGEAGFWLLDIAGDAGLIRHWHERLPEFKPTEGMIRFWRPMAESVD